MVGKAQRKNSAFTIVELILAIVVIGILSALVFVGYGAVVGNANDRAVQGDLTKISDALKLYNLDNQRYPSYAAEIDEAMSTNNFKATIASYALDTADIYDHNLDYCFEYGGADIFGVVAMSKSKKIFYVTHESGGVKEYSGTWPSTGGAICTAILPASDSNYRGYAPDDLVNGPWRSWTGVTNATIITNLATNPSAGSNTTGWSVTSTGGSSTTLSAVPTDGPASVVASFMRATLTSAPSSSPFAVSPVGTGTSGSSVDPSTDYTISAYFRTSCDLSSGLRIDIGEYNSAGTQIGTNSVGSFTTDVANTWQLLSRTYTTSATTAFIQYRFVYSGQTACPVNTTFDTTAVMVVDGPIAYGYADGNTPGWQWTGTANNSTSRGPAPGSTAN